MTFGEKLKEARKESGLSQEQLAEKISVSRSAVAKWESGKGMPDIGNLKAIAALLNTSIDYLLDDDEKISFNETKEPISLSDREPSGRCRDRRDAVCAAKHGDASAIYSLLRTRKMSRVEWWIDFFIQPGVVDILDQLSEIASYYLVEKGAKQYLVKVTKDFITTSELADRIDTKKFVIGKYKFTKSYQIL